MLSLKNRRRFLGLSLATVIVALITSALLSRINEERKLELNKAVGNNVEELPVTLGTPLNEPDTRIEQQGLVVNSTPQFLLHLKGLVSTGLLRRIVKETLY